MKITRYYNNKKNQQQPANVCPDLIWLCSLTFPDFFMFVASFHPE